MAQAISTGRSRRQQYLQFAAGITVCGILGWYKYLGNDGFTDADRQRFDSALNVIAHRGPDASRTADVSPNLLFGHRRLSIIDLHESNHQPFVSADGNFVLTYNGEIFNYLELREELISAGYRFQTNGDTEVVLHAYAHWGESCVNQFNGMWAFAIYDRHQQSLFCSRDRFGIKPFNYSVEHGEFVFCSEAKGILTIHPQSNAPNYQVIGNFLRKSVGAQLEQTWFDSIKRLMPAHNLTIKNGVVESYRYWQYPLQVNQLISGQDAEHQYLHLLQDSVRLRMRSDVPVGTTLSSGLDSTSLIALMRRDFDGEHNSYTAFSPHHSFSAQEGTLFKGAVSQDESNLVKQFAAEHNLRTNFIHTNHTDYIEQLDQLVHFLEAPHHSQSIVPLMQLQKAASKDVKVVLEGQGADELLGGYISLNAVASSVAELKKGHFAEAANNLLAYRKHYSLAQGIQAYVRGLDIDIAQRFFQRRSGYEKLYTGAIQKLPILKDAPFECPGFDDDFNRYLHGQHTGTLVDLLHYGDRISMANSLESRLPFMDYRLVEFAFGLPARMKVSAGLGKVIHRNAMQSTLPGYIVNNPHKFGFSTPLAKLFMNNAAESPASRLLSGSLGDSGLIDMNELRTLLADHQAGRINHSRVLYRLMGTDSWLRQYAA